MRGADRAHLTTEQASRIARLAGAKRVEPFHFSARYVGAGDRLLREVHGAFGASPSSTAAAPSAAVSAPRPSTASTHLPRSRPSTAPSPISERQRVGKEG